MRKCHKRLASRNKWASVRMFAAFCATSVIVRTREADSHSHSHSTSHLHLHLHIARFHASSLGKKVHLANEKNNNFHTPKSRNKSSAPCL